MSEDFNAATDAWRSVILATALTDPRSDVEPDLAVERHKEWCADMADAAQKKTPGNGSQ